MTSSLSFDRAAGYYDRTRQLPEAVVTSGIEAILLVAGPTARILDAGTGTGRLSIPLLKHGADLVGCDISRKMMEVLRQKSPAARLVEADVSRLPFPTAHFDAVTTCHVMHLVGPWLEALEEYRRVLRPGGVYINAHDEHVGTDSTKERIQEHWKKQVVSRGGSWKRPGAEGEDELRTALIEMGAKVERMETLRYSQSYSVHEVIGRIASRTHSSTWGIPEEIFDSTMRELRDWAQKEFEDLNQRHEDETAFVLEVARFSEAR